MIIVLIAALVCCVLLLMQRRTVTGERDQARRDLARAQIARDRACCERDSALDVLDAITDRDGWGSSIDDARALAARTLDTRDYVGQLRAARVALDELADRHAAEQQADLDAACIEDAGRSW